MDIKIRKQIKSHILEELNNYIWDEKPVDVTAEANFIWQTTNKLRGSYIPDKYRDVIITMIREPVIPIQGNAAHCWISAIYNSCEFDLKELCNLKIEITKKTLIQWYTFQLLSTLY